MEEYSKVSPSIREIINILQGLRPYEEIRIVADKDGAFDCYILEQSTRKVIKSGIIIPVKDIYKK